MSKHTPGPWWLSPKQQPTKKRRMFEHGESFNLMSGPVHFSIAEISGPSNFSKQEEMRANARLIGAAPDLLEALKKVLYNYRELYELFDSNGMFATHVECDTLATKAIQKAEGEGSYG